MNQQAETPGQELGGLGDAASTVHDLIGEFLDTAGVARVYGEPVEKGEHTVIPTAEVLAILGFGMGGGTGSGSEPGTQGAGFGSGGGGKTLSRPVAVVVASPGGVRVEPVVDVTKVAIAFFTAMGFMLTTLMGMMSAKKMRGQLRGES